MLAVIPAHNERATLPQVIAELRAEVPSIEVLVVDDGSTDGSAELLAELGVHVLRSPARLGVGASVRAGLRWALAHGHDRVVRLDADGQHDPRDVPALLHALERDGADAVVGSRHHPASTYRTPLVRRATQRLVAAGLSSVMKTRVSDPTSGFWVFGPRALPLLARRHPRGYAEPELLLLLWRHRFKVVEAPVFMRPRAAGRSSLTLPRAALAVTRTLLAIALAPWRAAAAR